MPIIDTVKGNVLDIMEVYDGMVHGCNCVHGMNSGVAKEVKKLFPGAYLADTETVLGCRRKMGSYSCYTTLSGAIIINAYTQYPTSDGTRLVDYEAVAKVFEKINSELPGHILAIPKIGAGVAMGDWDIIEVIINKSTPDVDLVLVEYDGK